jgi:hypothetical protein
MREAQRRVTGDRSLTVLAAYSRSSLICALRSKPENALILLPFAKSCVRLSQ